MPAKAVGLALLLAILAAGCWDVRDIEDYGFILGMGIDASPEARQELRFTFEVVMPAQAATGGGQSGAAAGQQLSPFWNMVVKEKTMGKALDVAASRMYQRPSLEHLRVVVLGEDVGRRGLSDVLDFLLRCGEVRRRVAVYVVSGEAEKALSVKPRVDPVNAVYLANLQNNDRENSSIPQRMDLGQVSRSIHEDRPFIVPRLVPGKEDVIISGGAVFKKARLVGWVTPVEVEGIRWITGRIPGGRVAGEVGGKSITYHIMQSKSSIKPRVQDGRLSLQVEIESEGMLAEKESQASALSPTFVDQCEQAIARQIEGSAAGAIKKLKHYGADVFGFGRAVERNYPNYWIEISPRWEEYFRAVDVNVHATVHIRRIGVVR